MTTFGDFIYSSLKSGSRTNVRGYYNGKFSMRAAFPHIARILDDKRVTLIDDRGYHYLVTPYVPEGREPEYFILEVYAPDGHWDDRVPGFYDDIKDMECKVEDWTTMNAGSRRSSSN